MRNSKSKLVKTLALAVITGASFAGNSIELCKV